MDTKEYAKQKASEAEDFVKAVNANFDGEIDPYLNRWSGSKVSGWIACGFGVAMLVIGGVLGQVVVSIFS